MTVYKHIGQPARIAHLTASGAACLALAACANGNMTGLADPALGVALTARPEAQAAERIPRRTQRMGTAGSSVTDTGACLAQKTPSRSRLAIGGDGKNLARNRS